MRRAGGEKQYSDILALQSHSAAPFGPLLTAVATEPLRNWSVQAMAAVAGQSPRNFHRRFVAATGLTPAKAVERVRAELAYTLLHSEGFRVSEVALQCGFGSDAGMRRAVMRWHPAPLAPVEADV
jgi:transcriptional regulator GlxA family with amidase domain